MRCRKGRRSFWISEMRHIDASRYATSFSVILEYSAGQPKLSSASDPFFGLNIIAEIAKLREKTRLDERKRLVYFLDRVKFASAAKIICRADPILEVPEWQFHAFPAIKISAQDDVASTF